LAFKIKGRSIAVSNDRIPTTACSICDLTPTLKQALKAIEAYATPDNQGYYGFHRGYGVYYEAVDYNKLLSGTKSETPYFSTS
jgi:hypothetical protein